MVIKRISVIYVFACCAVTLFLPVAFAHNVNLASFQLEQSDHEKLTVIHLNSIHKDWVLTVNMSLYNLHQSLLKTHSEEKLIQKGQYNKQLAADYLIKNTHIFINKKEIAIKLKVLDVNIGNHQSIFKFKMPYQPNDIKSLGFYIPAMSDNENQMNLVKVIGTNWNKHIVLKGSNKFRGELDATE